MNNKKYVDEIEKLLRELELRGGPSPSDELVKFLKQIRVNPLLGKSDKPSNKPPTRTTKKSESRRRRSPKDVSGTISELADRLRANFKSDEDFEKSVKELADSGLTKANVVKVYNSVFDSEKTFPTKTTKAALLTAFRKDRIAKLRASA